MRRTEGMGIEGAGEPIRRVVGALAAQGRAIWRRTREEAARRRELRLSDEWDGRAVAESTEACLDRIKRESCLHLQMRGGFPC